MSGMLTKAMARNVFYGGSVFFFLLFVGLTFDTIQGLPKTDNRHNLTEAAARGKHVWETRNCLGCHTLLGEGAYYAPELGNVYERRGPDFAYKAMVGDRPPPLDYRRKAGAAQP